jgi:hypothetical protein
MLPCNEIRINRSYLRSVRIQMHPNQLLRVTELTANNTEHTLSFLAPLWRRTKADDDLSDRVTVLRARKGVDKPNAARTEHVAQLNTTLTTF